MLGNKLITLRENKDLTKRFLASHFKINETTYGKWENNTRTPDIYTVKKLANYFDVSTDYLLDNEKKGFPIYKEANEITKAMNNVNDETRKRMLEMMKLAFPQAFDKYSWAINVIENSGMELYTNIKEGSSELSKEDIIRIAEDLKGRK